MHTQTHFIFFIIISNAQKIVFYVVFLFHHFMCRTVFSKFRNKRQELIYIQLKKLPIRDLMILKCCEIIVFLTNFRSLFLSAVFAQDKFLRREMISTDISRNMSQ